MGCDYLKKMKLIFLASIVLLTSCVKDKPDAADVSGYSETPIMTDIEPSAETAVTEPTEVKDFFAESDICVKLRNNGTPNSAVTHSSPAYAYDGNFYISIWHDNKFYRYDKNGDKSFVTDGVWNCFVKEDTMYCEDWGGATHSKSSLAILSGNEKNIIVEDCHFVYGKSAVYFKYSGEDELYSLAYDTQEIKTICEIPSGFYFNAEYNGKLWFKGAEGLYASDLNGNDIELIIPDCEKVMGYRNNCIYFMRNSNLHRYSIDENETKSFGIPLNEIHALNFTDSECLIADKNGLFAYNSNFSQSRKLLDIKSIRCISIIDDIIIVGYSDENNNEIYINIDNDGNILQKFED